MEKDEWGKNLYWITKEEAKSMKLIPVRCVFDRDDREEGKFKVYISDDLMWHKKFKTFEAFINRKDKFVETKCEIECGTDTYYVKEHGEWQYLGAFDITDEEKLRKYKFSDYDVNGKYTTQEDIEDFIKIKQAELDKELKQSKEARKEHREVLGWTDDALNF